MKQLIIAILCLVVSQAALASKAWVDSTRFKINDAEYKVGIDDNVPFRKGDLVTLFIDISSYTPPLQPDGKSKKDIDINDVHYFFKNSNGEVKHAPGLVQYFTTLCYTSSRVWCEASFYVNNHFIKYGEYYFSVGNIYAESEGVCDQTPCVDLSNWGAAKYKRQGTRTKVKAASGFVKIIGAR